MYKHRTMRPLAASLSIIAIVMTLVSGVTFAALQSQRATLTGNTLATATADIQISKDNTTYAKTLPGYNFANLIPGGTAVPINGNPIYVKNVGTSALGLKVSIDPLLANPDLVDLTKVHVVISPFGGGAPQNVTLQDLMTANLTGGLPITLSGANRVAPTMTFGFTTQMLMETDAVSGPSANISNLTFNFDAVAVN